MSRRLPLPRHCVGRLGGLLVAALLLGTGGASHAQSVTPCDLYGPAPAFPKIPVCAFTGAYRDSSLVDSSRCVGSFGGPLNVTSLADSVLRRPRTVTVRFRRDRRVEARPDFGGYRIYRAIGAADTSRLVLIRRFSRQAGDERTWNFSVVDTATLQFTCLRKSGARQVVNDSVVTFVDPDSSGSWIKICRRRKPSNGIDGRCDSPGDSIFVLRAPPGPHDGFRTWYAVTYEGLNTGLDGTYEDLFVPDLDHCDDPSHPLTCPNLNNKLLNMIPEPVEPTGGPTANLERVIVVPNPFRARAPWDQVGATEVHFINLPSESRIRIYTVAGDLIRELRHFSPVGDFERWDLKNQNGSDVSSGVYLFRVEAASFSFQDRFIVIR